MDKMNLVAVYISVVNMKSGSAAVHNGQRARQAQLLEGALEATQAEEEDRGLRLLRAVAVSQLEN